MKAFVWLIIVVAILFGGVFWYLETKEEVQPNVDNSAVLQVYRNERYGVSFLYPNTYELVEREVGTGEREHYTITLMQKSSLPLPQNGEGPPTISIDIYQNDVDKLSLHGWLTGTNFSNFKLGDGTYASTTVSGSDAVRYRWGGLYEGETVAFAHRDSIIAISGQYLDRADPIVSDFADLLGSVALF